MSLPLFLSSLLCITCCCAHPHSRILDGLPLQCDCHILWLYDFTTTHSTVEGAECDGVSLTSLDRSVNFSECIGIYFMAVQYMLCMHIAMVLYTAMTGSVGIVLSPAPTCPPLLFRCLRSRVSSVRWECDMSVGGSLGPGHLHLLGGVHWQWD